MMNLKIQGAVIIIYAIFLSGSMPAQVPEFPYIKGIYGHPPTLLAQGYRYDSLGVNAIFIRRESLTAKAIQDARAQQVLVFVEFPLLNGKSYLQDHPEAWPIDEHGEKSPPADWFMGICPSHEGFKKYRLQQLENLLHAYAVDGIWLDYVHWHAQFETPEPILPETCFCPRCVAAFKSYSQLDLPDSSTAQTAQYILNHAEPAWRKWRSQVILDWVLTIKSAVKAYNPDIALGVFHCGWLAEDHHGALYKYLGLDLVELAQVVDGLSPMLFHRLKGRPVDWVGTYMQWIKTHLADQKGTYIWPIVQAHNQPDMVTAEEFEQAMRLGMQAPATGIMMFSDQTLIREKTKVDVVRRLYRK